MKYGVVFFKETENIGDDIQTYAALKYLPQLDYVIEREKLSSFTPNKNELVTTIFNGWYNHDVSALPPSPFINPLFISIHLTNQLKKEKPRYLSKTFMNYLKQHQPIGLRDDSIKKYLDDAKIENYFSGCLTMTLDKLPKVKKTNKICLVDVDEEIYQTVYDKYKDDCITRTHKINKYINAALSFEQRMENVKDILKTYQSSKLVITSRLHVALPCLALNTPVLLIYDDKNIDVKNRLGKYIEYVNYVSKSEFLANPNYNIKAKTKHLNLRKRIFNKISDFIKDSANKTLGNEDIAMYKKYYVENKKHIDKIFSDKDEIVDNYESRIKEYERLYNELSLQKEFYQNQTEILKKNVAFYRESHVRLEQIRNSRSYHLYKKIRKILDKFKRIMKKVLVLGR